MITQPPLINIARKIFSNSAHCASASRLGIALLIILALPGLSRGATVTWSGASGTDTNWSTGGNWIGGTGTGGVPGSSDDVIFGNTGAGTLVTGISNVVDGTSGNFGGSIRSLQYTNTTANSFQNTLIAPGVTLNVTGNSGPFATALLLGTPSGAVANSVAASIQGAGGATLNVNNSSALIVVDQVASSSVRATLIMTNLDNFTANISRIGIGSDHAGLFSAAGQGTFYLARTNVITTSFVGDYSQPYTVVLTNAIEIGTGNAGNQGANLLYLGQTNAIFTDSIGVGMVKDTAAPGGFLGFNPGITNNNPSAYFRGISGTSSRVTSWGIADNGRSGNSSATTIGTVDFTGGTVDILVDKLFLGRDRQSGTAATLTGTLTFTGGSINANSLIIGNQTANGTGSSGCLGTVNVGGSTATLTVNSSLELGHTTLSSGNAITTKGTLNIVNGTVRANNVLVGASSTVNVVGMTNAMLVVTNTLATNAAGIATFSMTNSTLMLDVASSAYLRALVGTLTTGGATNTVWLMSVPVFTSYPRQFPLIKYTNSVIAGVGMNLGLTNVPASALNAYLSNNVLNRTIDLVLPTAPFPVVTGQPQGLALSPGDTANYSVTATGTPALSYQWQKNGTNLTEGGSVSGSTTSALALSNVQTNDDGYYSVVIANSYGATTSAPAILFVSSSDVPPFVTTQPQSLTVISNQNATLTVAAGGKPLPSYRWQKNGTDLADGGRISGSGTSTLTISQAQVSDEGTYSVALTNTAGFTNSDGATLTVNIPVVITTQPTNQTVLNGAAVCFAVAATGKPVPTYQWLKNGFPITDATNATLCFASVAPGDAAVYSVIANNAAGPVTSSNATLLVNSTMAVVSLSPTNGAAGICPDTPLQITFDTAPVIGSAGRIRIFNATNTTTPVDTLDLSQNLPNGTQARTIAGISFNAYPVIITGNTANIYPHLGVLTTNQTYYVTIEDVLGGAFKDGAGATFAGISATNTWRFTTKPTGPANSTNLVVAADGTGDFCTVQGACDFLTNGNTGHILINIRNGTYTEIVRLNTKHNVTFRGQNRQQTIIAYANNDTVNGGTGGRPSFGILGANDVAIENLTLTNSTPKGGSQAETLYLNVVRRFILLNADLKSYQDTLLVNNTGDQAYFQDNLIQGDTDFVWGQGNAFFTNCEIRCQSTGSHVTQSRTPANTNGFSFVHCTLTRSNATVTGCDLGRSLGFTDGNVGFLLCLIDDHITGWGDTTARDWEYANSNLTATAAVTYNGVQLTNTDPRTLCALDESCWLYGWIPQLAPNIITQPASLSVAGSAPASFTVAATGLSAPTYQWQHSGTNLPGATSPTLNLASAHAGDAGNYSVIVSNAAGVVTSSTATLTVGNTAPTLNPVGDYVVNVGVTVNVTNQAADPDVPPQILAFTLLAGPTNATLGSASGVLSFRPLVAQAGTSNYISLQVADNGSPSLSATQNFSVTVNALTASTLAGGSYAGGLFSASVSGDTGPDYAVRASTNFVDWETIFATNSPAMPFNWSDTNAGLYPLRFYRIQAGPPLP